MHTHGKWRKTKSIAKLMVPLMTLSQGQGMEMPNVTPEQWGRDEAKCNGEGFVYRDGLIRRNLDEINMIFKRCGFLKKDGTADLFRIPSLDDKLQRDNIRRSLEKAYLAHYLNADDEQNLKQLETNLKSWKHYKSIFNIENQNRLNTSFSRLFGLLQNVNDHITEQKILRFLSNGDLHWISSCQERAKAETEGEIPPSFKLLEMDLNEFFGVNYIKNLPIYKHSIPAQEYHRSIFDGCSKQWHPDSLAEIFMELVQLKTSLNTMGNSEERRTFGDGVSEWLSNFFEQTTKPKPLYCEEVRKIKEHIENLQAYILCTIEMDIGINLINEQLQKDSSPNYLLRELLGKSKEIWILALDGGGVRGKIATEILRNLSCQLKERGIDCPLSELFHFLGGTSVGGLIVLALSSRNEKRKPAFNEEEIADLLEHEQASRIFPHMDETDKKVAQGNSYAYPPEHLQRLLLANFGYGTLSNLGKPTMLMTHSNRTQKPIRLRNYDPSAEEVSLMSSGLATSAAVPYFPATTIFYNGNLEECSDGGFSVNNPAADSLEEVLEILKKREGPMPRINLLSIGTGKVPYNYPHGSFKTGLAGAVTNLSEGGMQKSVKESHKKVLLMFQNYVKQGGEGSYYRINPPLEQPIALDDSSRKNLSFLTRLDSELIFPSAGYTTLADHLAGNRDLSRNEYVKISGKGDKRKAIR